MVKKCIGECGLEKSPDHFNGRSNQCKTCKSKYDKEYKKKNKNKIETQNKKYREENKEKIVKQKRQYYRETREIRIANEKKYRKDNTKKIIVRKQNYYQEHKEKIKENIKEYKKTNKNKILAKNRKYFKIKRRLDPEFRIRQTLSKSINFIIKKNGSYKNNISCLSSLGEDYAQRIKAHIESKFEWWMTWDNQGTYQHKKWDDNDSSTWVWNIDHIIPHSYFIYTSSNSIECIKAWALSNLRPISAKQNLIDNCRPADTKLHKDTMNKILLELGLNNKE